MMASMARKIREKPYGKTELGDRLLAARVALRLSQQKLGDLAGMDRLDVLGIESGNPQKLSNEHGKLLAAAFKVPREILERYLDGEDSLDDFLLAHSGRRAPPGDLRAALVQQLSARTGVGVEILMALSKEDAGAMDEMTENLRRAVMGVVYLLGYPLETTIAAAKMLMVERGNIDIDAEEWFAAIRKKLPPRPPTGTFPASSEKIKSVPAIS